MYRFSGKDGVTKQRSNTLKVVHLGFCKKWKVQSMRYEQNRIPSLLNSIANGHVHTLPPCCDLVQSMPSPWPTESIYSQRMISLNQHYLLHLTNKYHSISMIFLVFRIQEDTYWNSFAIHFSEQYNTARSTKASLHIYELSIFKQHPSQAKEIITKNPQWKLFHYLDHSL